MLTRAPEPLKLDAIKATDRLQISAETPGDIIRDDVADAANVLHVVSDNGDGETLFEFLDCFLDFSRRDRIERRGGLPGRP